LRFLSFFFSSRRRHTRFSRDWSSDVCSSDLEFFFVGDNSSIGLIGDLQEYRLGYRAFFCGGRAADPALSLRCHGQQEQKAHYKRKNQKSSWLHPYSRLERHTKNRTNNDETEENL